MQFPRVSVPHEAFLVSSLFSIQCKCSLSGKQSWHPHIKYPNFRIIWGKWGAYKIYNFKSGGVLQFNLSVPGLSCATVKWTFCSWFLYVSSVLPVANLKQSIKGMIKPETDFLIILVLS